MSSQSLGLYLLQDGTHAEPGACEADPAGVLRHKESKLAVCTYEDGTPQTVGQDAINNMNVEAANPVDPTAPGEPPVIAAIAPASCAIGDPDFTLIVSGTGFAAASVIHFAGNDEPTTLNADGTLSTGVKPSLWGAPVVVQCSVRNGTLHSNAVDFTFAEAGGTSRKSEEPKPGHVTRETPVPAPDRGRGR